MCERLVRLANANGLADWTLYVRLAIMPRCEAPPARTLEPHRFGRTRRRLYDHADASPDAVGPPFASLRCAGT